MIRKFTGERLEPHIFDANAIKHLHRYSIITPYIKDKIILDIACGEGYGSNLMCEYASVVFGVDIDGVTIKHAKEKYKRKNLNFLEGSTSIIPLKDNSIEVVVSFETLEHHDQHDQMFIEIKRVLKPNGILIISTPDKYYYSDIRNYKNKFHVKELYKEELIRLTSRYFQNSNLLIQSYLNGNSIIFNDNSIEKLKYFTGTYSKTTEFETTPEFMIAILSDFKFEECGNSIFDGTLILKSNFENKKNEVYNSITYRVGNILLAPFKLMSRFLTKKIDK